MNTKDALRKILSTLHPNTILKPNLDSNAHPQPSAYSKPYTQPRLNIGTELVGEGTSSRRVQRQMRYALESG